MTIKEAIESRHTIRAYDGKAIEGEQLAELEKMISEINETSGLHFQLVNGNPDALTPFTIHYGKWTGVTNIIALIGKEKPDLDALCGYYGEQIVLWAEMNKLKTGWVETAYESVPEFLDIPDGERLVITICIGASDKIGVKHKVKSLEELSTIEGEMPEWFKSGMEYAQLAPSAGNQQLFNIAWDGEHLSISTKPGFLEQVDVGIAQYHFELGSGMDHKEWK